MWLDEAIPHGAPPPREKEVDLCIFVDRNNAGNKQTRRSRTGFMACMNMSWINWYFKKQSTIENSVFGAEFVVMKVRAETLHAIQHKLRMIGIPILGPSCIYGDKMWVIDNTSKPDSTLKKKCNAITYHAICECVSTRESLTGHIRWEDNLAYY